MNKPKMKSVDDKFNVLKTIVLSNILEEGIKIEKIPREFRDTLPSFLNKTDGKVEVKPWLKARLFETAIASVGMDEYLKELLRDNEIKPEDVPMNSFLSSFLISNSANRFILELVNQSVDNREIDLSQDQIEALSLVYRPRKNYAISRKDIFFRSEQVQNTKNAVLRKSLDILSAYEHYRSLDLKKGFQFFDRIPRDLEKVSSTPDFTIEQLMSISQKFRSQLNLSFVEGYLVWQFRDRPAVFIKAGQAYYSPKYSQTRGTTTYEQADRQAYHFIEQLETTRLSIVRCSICKERSTSHLFYHLDKGVIPICKECARTEQKVVGFVSKITNKT